MAVAEVLDDVERDFEEAKGYKMGDLTSEETTLGPLNSARQRERVEGFCEIKHVMVSLG